MNDELAGLALAVRDARKQRKWGQRELAAKAGVSLGVISNLERGLTRPQPANERAILGVLDLERQEPVVDVDSRDWPDDVAVVLDVVGLVLSSIPDDRRQAAIHGLTRYVMGLPAAAASPQSMRSAIHPTG